MLVLSLILAALGLCFGSFVNAAVWRLRQQKLVVGSRKFVGKKSTNYKLQTTNLSILRGRSMCPNCGHQLAALDLIPVLSWLFLRGKCRYCGQKIPWQYPLVELAGALTFAISYIFWPVSLQPTGNLVLFITWLVCSVGLLALAVYDFKWMLLPSKIIYPTLLVALAGQLIYLAGFAPNKPDFAANWLAAVLIASGFFWLIFMASGGKWIGYGDVRLGLITGTLLQTPARSLLMIFIASLLGTALALPLMMAGKKTFTAKLPFGPFLIISTLVCLLIGQDVINWYQNLLTR